MRLASVLHFTENNQLVAPGGIWDLALDEHSDGLASIWRPENPSDLRQTSFSYNRAARIRDYDTFELLDIFDENGHESGLVLGAYKFRVDFSNHGDYDRVFIRQLSRSGKKVILQFYEASTDKSTD